MLHAGRYRLLEQVPLPDRQDQEFTYLAQDAQNPLITVFIRRVVFPTNASSNGEKTVQSITQRLMDLAQHSGFLPVIDVFQERGASYIVQLYPEGESLASLLKQQGGALPEREVAEYGLQVCAMLSLLAQPHPPLVHGSITPETLLINLDKRQVWLLHFPLFPPQAPPRDKAATGYLAPEQIRGEFSPSSDLYSLAATLHHAVTGYDPNERLAFFYPPARRLNPVVTPQMETILAHALRLSIQQRFTHPSQMQQELSKLIASYPPATSTSASTPFLLKKEQIRQLSHQKSRRNLGIASGVSVAIIFLFLILSLYPLLSSNLSSNSLAGATATTTAQQALYQKELNLELQAYHQANDTIGLSDGRLAFDIYPGRTKTDIDLKQQAASALQQGNISNAINLLTQATTADPADGEAQIYDEDLHVLLSGAPSITVVLGLPIGNNVTFLFHCRVDLEAAYLAQHEINSKGLLPHGLRLRLLIDSSGTSSANVAKAAQFVANRVVKTGNFDHIVGVVGWPTSSESINAHDIINGIPLPMVSQTASSVQLSGSSPYFFRVNPSDSLSGATLGSVAVEQLHAKTVLVLQDPKDPYSVSLASAFSNRLKTLHATAIDDTVNFTEQTTTVQEYEQTTIPNAIAKGVDLIFLAGEDADAIRLAHAVGETSRANPASMFLANLKIMGGDALGSSILLGKGTSSDAAISASFPQDMQRLIFATFAHPDEWTFLKVPQNQQPALFADWSATYENAPPGASCPSSRK